MNLHPITVLLLVMLAFLFYSQGQFFFLFATLAIGFLLLIVSLSTPQAHGAGESHATSVYPEKMEIKVLGDEGPPPEGQVELGQSVAGAVDFAGKVTGWFFDLAKPPKEEKKEGHH